jgi:hypothetical protein
MAVSSKMIRLNAWEVEEVRNKSIDINKKLIRLDKEPLKDSELVHKILELGLKNISVSKEGDLEI